MTKQQADVIQAAREVINNPAWAGICDQDLKLEQALKALDSAPQQPQPADRTKQDFIVDDAGYFLWDQAAIKYANEVIPNLRKSLAHADKRASEAEATIERLFEQQNSENGPTHMGEPVIAQPANSVPDGCVLVPIQKYVGLKMFKLGIGAGQAGVSMEEKEEAEWENKYLKSAIDESLKLAGTASPIAQPAAVPSEPTIVPWHELHDDTLDRLYEGVATPRDQLQAFHAINDAQVYADIYNDCAERLEPFIERAYRKGALPASITDSLNIVIDHWIKSHAPSPAVVSGEAVPEGYALVPIEPTREMLDAAFNSTQYDAGFGTRTAVYKAFVAAAQPDKGKAIEVKE